LGFPLISDPVLAEIMFVTSILLDWPTHRAEPKDRVSEKCPGFPQQRCAA
jgi:hypothetical protein